MVTRNSRGYTLIELLMTVAIIGLISSTGAMVTQKTFQSQAMADALETIQQGAFISFDVINKLLRQATASSIVIDQYDANQPPWSRITFTNPNTAQTCTFYQIGQTLYINKTPAFKNLRSLAFSYPNTAVPNVISVSLTFEKAIGLGQTKAIQLFIQKVKIQN
jgi:prepilin-type N-terminal cleavage/methylation domain-containing protein